MDKPYFVKHKSGSSLFFLKEFLEAPVASLLCTNREKVGEKWSTVCTHMHADCLLNHASIKNIKYFVNQTFEHFDGISVTDRKRPRRS
jgi:hypothetical protein